MWDKREEKQIALICKGEERRSISETEYQIYQFHIEVDFMESLIE
jgi:hypothetical protein